jgi:hypothetical protein
MQNPPSMHDSQVYYLFTQNNNLKLVAERWRLLSPKEKAVWEEQSRQDKRRYIKGKYG